MCKLSDKPSTKASGKLAGKPSGKHSGKVSRNPSGQPSGKPSGKSAGKFFRTPPPPFREAFRNHSRKHFEKPPIVDSALGLLHDEASGSGKPSGKLAGKNLSPSGTLAGKSPSPVKTNGFGRVPAQPRGGASSITREALLITGLDLWPDFRFQFSTIPL